MRRLLGFGVLASLFSLCACAEAQDPFAEFKTDAVNATPTSRAVAASNTFYFCNEHPEPDRYTILCEACDVTLHRRKSGQSQDGLVVYASHVRHDLRPRDDNPRPRLSRTGDVASETYRSETASVEDAKRLFSEANDWCQSRQKGEFVILKNEIETTFESDAE